MNNAELMKLRVQWYSQPLTLIEMVKNMGGREVAFLECKTEMDLPHKAIPVRCIKAHSMEYLKKNFDAFDFFNKPYNIYCSVATFRDMPVFSFAPAERKTQQTDFFKGDVFSLCWTGYDMVFDLDAPTIEESYADAKKLKKILDDFGLIYSVKFSGKQGFHFVIKDENFFAKELKLTEKVFLANKIAQNISEIENIPSIDLAIYQSARLLKTPYSLEGFNVALPLSDEQFNNFKVENMRVDNVLREVRLMYRGLLERKGLNKSKDFISMYGVFK